MRRRTARRWSPARLDPTGEAAVARVTLVPSAVVHADVDEHGIRHAHACPRPGWTSRPSTALPGVHVCHCPGCGAVRLTGAPTGAARP